MVFASPVFLFIFMPVAVLFCGTAGICGKATLRNVFLLLLSLLFYAWGEPVYVLLMLAEIVLNFILGRFAAKSRIAFISAVILDLGILAVFKYLDMIIGAVNVLPGVSLPLAQIALPIGISFYTFQILSYIIDVRRGDVPPEHSFIDFAVYVTMFPQLIAGPIVRYIDVRRELGEAHTDITEAASGAVRFCFGMAKKVLIANTLAECAKTAFANANALSPLSAWLGIIAYALQIYYDFSGYSDMAIGIGRMLGFHFLENFDYPYISSSVREFWRRWHISLSGWFRDYVYIPLGGSRRGTLRTYRNLLIIFILCGLWHGASVNFLLWGLWHGIFLCIERIPVVTKLTQRIPTVPRRILGHVYTLLVVLFGWILFNASTLTEALTYFRSLFGGLGMTPDLIFDAKSIAAMAAGAVFSVKLPRPKDFLWWRVLSTAVGFVLLAACAVCLAGGTYNPFIYFRF